MNKKTVLAVCLLLNTGLVTAGGNECPVPVMGFKGPFSLADDAYKIVRADQFGLVQLELYLKKEINSLDLLSANLRREVDGKITSRVELNIDRSASLVWLSLSEEELSNHTLQLSYGKWVECTNHDHLSGVMTNRTLYEIRLEGN